MEFQANSSLVNKELANRSHNGTSWDPEKRAEQEITGFAEELQTMYEELKPYAKSEAQKNLLVSEMLRFQTTYAEKYNAKLAAHGNCISTFVTGASNFPTRRAQKANNTYDNRITEMLEFKARARAAIIRELKKLQIEEAGGELEVLKMKIAKAEKLQAAMKATNTILRKKTLSDTEKITAIIQATGFSETTTRKLLMPDFCGRIGFSYHLQNNLQNIKRMKERLAELQTKESTPTSEITFNGGTIVDSQEADRIQILFDEKPPQDTINKLKATGWHWSPANMAWQRKRTPQALENAKRLTGVV